MSTRPDSVLLVDDDPMVRMLVKSALVQRGLDVTDVAGGRDALASFRQHRPDIVLLDAMMPEMDGFQTCRELRALPDGEHVPVIMLTGLDDEQSIARAYESGATDFFIKSPLMALLTERIRYLLRTARMREELVIGRAKLAKAQRIARLGSWEWDLPRRTVVASEECYRLIGLPFAEEDFPEEKFFTAFFPDGVDAFRFEVLAGLKIVRSHSLHGQARIPEGTRTIDIEVEAERDEAAHVVRIIGTIQDVTERRQAEEHVRRLANYDSLTGLANRSLFRSRFEEGITKARRNNEQLAVLCIGLDRFKVINDTLGRAAGDALLLEIATRLNRSVRSRDAMARTVRDGENAAVARLGGDEFIVLLSDLAAPGDAGRVADRILDALKRPVVIDGQECWVGASIGIASFPDDGDSAEMLLARADAAMYEAKTAGRGVWRAYQPSLVNPNMETLRLEGDLRKAVQRGELRLYWQPIVDISTGKIAGCEALMRWQRGDKLVSPAEFIPLAEETGLIIPMGEWALETACTQLAEWNKAGLDGIYVGVNITSKHVQQRDLLKVIKQVLAASHLPADRLVVEITETGLMDFIDSTLRTLTSLRELGVRIAIDDFGTGYSSLSYLKRLPISTLKIDRAFVKEVDHDMDDAAIVSAVSGIARSLSLSVVAEGVETVEQSAVLFEHGVKLMQGYYYSRPVPAVDFEKLLRATSGAACRADWIASGRGLQSGIA